MKKQTKIPANKTGDAKEKRIVLVGTYKGGQLGYRPGWYCWPLDREDSSRAKSAKERKDKYTIFENVSGFKRIREAA